MSQNTGNFSTKLKAQWWYPTTARISVLVIAITLAFTVVWSIKKFYSSNDLPSTSVVIKTEPVTTSQKRSKVDQIADTVQELKKYKSDYTNVPKEIRPLLTTLKHQLKDLITETINDPVNKDKSADQLSALVKALLKDNAIINEHSKLFEAFNNKPNQVLFEDTNLLYGDIDEINFEYPKEHVDLLAVTTNLTVFCGSDTSFYLFKKDDNQQWKLYIAQEVNDYDEVSSAQGWLQYALSAKDKDGNFFVVTLNTTSWCTSNGQLIKYRAIRAGDDAYSPHILLQNQETIYLSDETQLKVTRDGFTLKFSGQDENPDILVKDHIVKDHIVKDHIVKYQIKGGDVRCLRRE